MRGRSPAGGGLGPWLLQRLTALLLLFALGLHIWAIHFVDPVARITFQSAAERIRSPLFLVTDLALLAAGILHGLNGVRIIALDFGLRRGWLQALTWLLAGLGVFGFMYGMNALWPFLSSSGKPLLQELWWSRMTS